MTFRLILRMTTHVNCRNGLYPFSNIERFPVPDNKVDWLDAYAGYNPPDYTAPDVMNKPFADPDIEDFSPKFNSYDTSLEFSIDRRSRMGIYAVKDHRPLNPEGRTGIKGRGSLAKWGPNQAADPIVTRWKREKNYIVIHHKSSRPVLQFCAIKRKDTGIWALPGGMIWSGEVALSTLRREFVKNVLNIDEQELSKHKKTEQIINELFTRGEEVYRGYIDDPRNTDNAWIETVAVNYHDDIGTLVQPLALKPFEGKATKVKWMDIEKTDLLSKAHVQMLQDVSVKHHAHY